MATLREFFVTEAADYLAQLTGAVQQLDSGSGDPTELHRHTRGLRGSAQMAREERVYRAALGLEAAARSVANGIVNWTEDISTRIRRTLEDIDALVKGEEPDDSMDQRLKRALERWKEAGVEVPTQEANTAPLSEASRQFMQFAAHEVTGIVTEMQAALETLAEDPRSRDPLKAILRRQRALLGAARLDEISVVAEALRGTEDMTRVIAKLNVPVKEEWLAVFRSARDVLRAAIEPLQRGEAPSATPALSKLRTLRQELLDRYGEGEAVAVTAGPTPAATAATGTYTPPPSTAAPKSFDIPSPAAKPVVPPEREAADNQDHEKPHVVSIDHLQYQGVRALQRALELQPVLERIAGDNAEAREQVNELFDLIRLGAT
jgi:chemotaxis protein histidine kinase CheA